ncbi:hypothetical protein [Clostridium uliginosum]|uniref:Uncharacterized protein n=1 Tax=Clostridium uliginosum TaxID=119641 RepID=A0A1I1NPY0_9CLOT|nr:hypothetical protein [Clostridium uliginosum]SFC99699.1 hypothetical protein SAMN05421842_11637 [Clostridium uliginosum]
MNNFEPNQLVKECIANKDIMGLKGALVGIIFSNRSFSNGEFDNTLERITSKGINIYEKFDGEDIVCNTIKGRSFTEDDFAEAVYYLKVNFCQERIKDVKKISKKIYIDSCVKVNTGESAFKTAKNGENSEKKHISHQTKMNQNKKNNSIKIIAGIAVVAAIAIAIKIMK